jgi:hypothetical protein
MAATSSDYGVKSARGHIGLPIASNVKYTALKTGVIIVSAPEFTKMSGSAALEPASGSFPVVNWRNAGPVSPLNCRIAATIKLPRGATIAAVEAYVKNTDTLFAYSAIGAILSRNLWNGTTVSVASVLTASVTVPASQDGWLTLGTTSAQQAPVGEVGVNNSGFFNVDLDFATPTSSGTAVYFGALRITYSYTTVDFMV